MDIIKAHTTSSLTDLSHELRRAGLKWCPTKRSNGWHQSYSSFYIEGSDEAVAFLTARDDITRMSLLVMNDNADHLSIISIIGSKPNKVEYARKNTVTYHKRHPAFVK